jgi:hypothetical protein
MALGVGHRPEAIVFFLTGGIPEVETVLLSLILAELVVILENSQLVVFWIRIAFEDKQHAGLAHSAIPDGNNRIWAYRGGLGQKVTASDLAKIYHIEDDPDQLRLN